MEIKIIDNFKIVFSNMKYEESKELRDFLSGTTIIDFLKKLDKNIIIVLGGDGTMLEAVHEFFTENKAFLGINFGHKGFLMNDLNILKNKLNLKKNSYPLLSCKYFGDEKVFLNEIDISSCFGRMANLKISLGNNYSLDLIGDGLIISSPIGSSGYNVSLGGPIIPHNLETFVLSPKAPWKPTKQSPMLIDNKEKITIKLNNPESKVDIYGDGVLFKQVRDFEKEIIIQKSQKNVDLYFNYTDDSYPYFKVLQEQGFSKI
ncbi:MAG: NAD(+)/NADH kinase [Candidatus Gracilibacteria bacterium]|nr:NAD(+)/NADH kinase [Candidatus Gracilibacteria bacterium]